MLFKQRMHNYLTIKAPLDFIEWSITKIIKKYLNKNSSFIRGKFAWHHLLCLWTLCVGFTGKNLFSAALCLLHSLPYHSDIYISLYLKIKVNGFQQQISKLGIFRFILYYNTIHKIWVLIYTRRYVNRFVLLVSPKAWWCKFMKSHFLGKFAGCMQVCENDCDLLHPAAIVLLRAVDFCALPRTKDCECAVASVLQSVNKYGCSGVGGGYSLHQWGIMPTYKTLSLPKLVL